MSDVDVVEVPAPGTTDVVEVGLRGMPGRSAYLVAVDNGFSGTEEEWLDSLQVIPDGTATVEYVDDQDDALQTSINAAQAAADAAQDAADAAQAAADTAQTAANLKLAKAQNLADLANATTARTNLGLGNSATRAVGTTTGTVAAGDDSRFATLATAAADAQDDADAAAALAATKLAIASNLSDLADAATARTNLGLGNSATRAVGTTTGTVTAGDDSRFTTLAVIAGNAASAAANAQSDAESAQITADSKLSIAGNLSDVNDAALSRINLGLGNVATLDVGTTAGTVAAGDDSRFTLDTDTLQTVMERGAITTVHYIGTEITGSDLNTSGSVIVGTTLEVGGNTQLDGSLLVYSGATITGALGVTGGTTTTTIQTSDGSTSGVAHSFVNDTTMGMYRIGSGILGFATPHGLQVRISDTVATCVNFLNLFGGAAGAAVGFTAAGSDTNVQVNIQSKGAASINFNKTRSASTVSQHLFTDSGGLTGDTAAGFWRGMHIAPPSFTVSGVAVNPRFALYGEYDSLTDPTTRNFYLDLGSATGTGQDHSVILRNNTGGNLAFNTSGGTQALVSHIASAVNYTQLSGGATGNAPTVSARGTDTNINFTFGSKGTGSINLCTNGTANLQVEIRNTTTAVNYIRLTGAATTAAPAITAQGSDATVGLGLFSKSTGNVDIGTGGSIAQLRVSDVSTADGTNPLIVSGGTSSLSPGIGSGGTGLVVYGPSASGSVTLRSGGRSGVTQLTINHVASALNYWQVEGGASGTGATFRMAGPLTQIAVTSGGAHTAIPTLSISGGSTGAATVSSMFLASGTTVSAAGTGYTIGDVLTLVGGTFSTSAQITVSTVTSGGVATFTVSRIGTYTVLPSSPVAVTGGTGSGATFTASWGVAGVTITTGGTYLTIPTVTTGTGSGTLFAVQLGSIARIQSQAPGITFGTANGEALRIVDRVTAGNTTAVDQYVEITPGQGGVSRTSIGVAGSGSVSNLNIFNRGGGAITFSTSGAATSNSFAVEAQTSAVNYPFARGGATANPAVLGASASSTDTNVGLTLLTKGTGTFSFLTNTSVEQFRVNHLALADQYITVIGGIGATNRPKLSTAGSATASRFEINNHTAAGILFSTNNGTGQFQVEAVGSAVNQAAASGSVTTGPVIFGVGSNSTDADVGVVHATKGAAHHEFYTNTSVRQFRIINVASAINYLQVAGAATAGAPEIAAAGSDANVLLHMSSKGSSPVRIYSNGALVTEFQGVTSAINRLRMSNAITAGIPFLQVFSTSDTNVPLALVPLGTGAFQLAVTDSGTTGGNARGANAVDLQTARGSASQVASGAQASLIGGSANTASGAFSICGGQAITVSGGAGVGLGSGHTVDGAYSSAPGGLQGAARANLAKLIWASGKFTNAGDAQTAWHVVRASTTDATATRLTADQLTATTNNSVQLPNNGAYAVSGEVIARNTSTGDVAMWTIRALMKRGANAAATALVGSATVTMVLNDSGASTWVIAVTADTTNGAVAVTATGVAATTIHWVAKVETVEVL